VLEPLQDGWKAFLSDVQWRARKETFHFPTGRVEVLLPADRLWKLVEFRLVSVAGEAETWGP